MRFLPAIRRRPVEERQVNMLPFQEWVNILNYNGVLYPLPYQSTIRGDRENIEDTYLGLAAGTYASNSVVFACIATRMLHFSEARFVFRQLRAGRTGNIFGTPELGILEVPWPNGTTGDLLARMLLDVDLSGNSYVVRRGDRLARLRPDWVSILLGSRTDRKGWEPGDPDTEIVGYVFKPGGKRSPQPEMLFSRQEVAHFAPFPDPTANYRGMSWLTPLIREIQADSMMTTHKSKFLEQGATVNLVVKVPADTLDKFNQWVSKLEEGHRGLAKAYRTMYLGAGADVTPVGADLQQMDFKQVQGAGEVRIAAAARVPPTILGISEGLQGSTLNAGNYQSARRNFADGLLRPLWRQAAGALASVIVVPGGAELWYDDSDIAFLKEDLRDAAQIQQLQSTSMRTLVDGGWTPESIVDAVTSYDFTRLVHSGLPTVQVQPGTPSGNGSGTLAPAQIPATTGGGG